MDGGDLYFTDYSYLGASPNGVATLRASPAGSVLRTRFLRQQPSGRLAREASPLVVDMKLKKYALGWSA